MTAIEKIDATARHNKEISEKMKRGTGNLDATVAELLELISRWSDGEDQESGPLPAFPLSCGRYSFSLFKILHRLIC